MNSGGAIQTGAPGDEIGNLALPESYRAAVVRKDEQEMWAGVDSADKDPRKSLHIDEVKELRTWFPFDPNV